MSRRALTQGAGLAALAGGLVVAAAAAPAEAQPSASGIVGSWRLRTNSTNPQRPQIDRLYVFIPGGIALAFDTPAVDAASTSSQTTGTRYAGTLAGQWLQLPSGAIQTSWLGFFYKSTGAIIEEQHLEMMLTYDGGADTISGTANWRAQLPDGRVRLSGFSEVHGSRVGITR